MSLLPPPDVVSRYVDTSGRPSRDFYNWIKALYEFARNATSGGGAGSGVPGGSVGQVQYNAGSGNFGGYTGTQVTALLDQFSTSAKGVVPLSPGGVTAFLRADGTWQVPPAGGGGGSAPGGSTGQIQANAGGGSFAGLTDSQVTTHIDVFTSLLKGAVPPGGSTPGSFLRNDGVFAIPPGGGGGGGFTLYSVQTSIVGNPASNVETTLLSYTLPANTLTVVGTGIKIKAAGYWGNDSHQAAIRLYFGSDFALLANVAIDGTTWTAEADVVLVSTGPTRSFLTLRSQASFPTVPGFVNSTADLTNPVLIKVTGQGPNAGIANEAVCYQLIVEQLC